MSFQMRYITQDPVNGILAAGFLTPEENPEYFQNLVSPSYRCSLILNGNGHFEDARHEKFLLKPGSVYQVPPSQPFYLSINSNTPWREFCICIGADAYQSLHSIQLLNVSPVFQIELKAYLLQWMPVLVEELGITKQAELSECFFNTQKLLINIHKENLEFLSFEKSLIIESTKQLLSSSYNQNISFQEVAARFQIGYEKFRKMFREGTGMSPLQFQLTIRFRYAQRYLTDGMSVKEVALKTGYADPYIFSKQFKKYTGQSPKEYKEKVSNK